MFRDVMEEVTPEEAAEEDAFQRQMLVNEVMASQFETGTDEQRLAMAFLGGLFSFFTRYPAELIPEAYVESYEVMYGELPAHTKALLGSLIGFVASGFDGNQEQHDMVLAMARGTQAAPGYFKWSDDYDDENALVVLDQVDFDAIFERFARVKYADTIGTMEQVGLQLKDVVFTDGEVTLEFEPTEGLLDLAVAETLDILADPDTMAAIAEGVQQVHDGLVTEVTFLDARERDDGNAWDDMGTYFEGEA